MELCEAVLSQDENKVKEVLKNEKVDVNWITMEGISSFTLSTLLNNIKIVEVLLQDERVEVNMNKNGDAPLYEVCSRGKIPIIKMLLSCPRANFNHIQKIRGVTPFYTACVHRQYEAVNFLVSCNQVDILKLNQDPLDNAVHLAIKTMDDQLLRILMKRQMTSEEANLSVNNLTYLTYAIYHLRQGEKRKVINMINTLLYSQKEINPHSLCESKKCAFSTILRSTFSKPLSRDIFRLLYKDTRTDKHKHEVLMCAIYLDLEDKVIDILSLPSYQVQETSPKNGILHTLCSKNMYKAMKLVLKKEYTVELKESIKDSMIFSCYKGHLKMVKLIVKSGHLEKNRIYLERAVTGKQVDVVRFLLKTGMFDVNEGEAFFQSVVCKTIFEIFIRQPTIRLDYVPENGGTIFLQVCRRGTPDQLKQMLLDPRVDVKSFSHNGESPLYLACANKSEKFVLKLLRDPRIDINGSHQYNPLTEAFRRYFYEVIEKLLAHPEIKVAHGHKTFLTLCDSLILYKDFDRFFRLILQSDEFFVPKKKTLFQTIGKLIVMNKPHLAREMLFDLRTELIFDHTMNQFDLSPFRLSSGPATLDLLCFLVASGRADDIFNKIVQNKRLEKSLGTKSNALIKQYLSNPLDAVHEQREKLGLKRMSKREKFLMYCSDGNVEEVSKVLKKPNTFI